MNFQAEITDYKTSLQSFFLSQIRVYQRLYDRGLTTEEATRDVELIQSYISSVFQTLEDLIRAFNRFGEEYRSINNIVHILRDEKERALKDIDKILLTRDEEKIRKAFSTDIREAIVNSINKFNACIEMTKDALVNNGYADREILLGNSSKSIIAILDRLTFISNNIIPENSNGPFIEPITDGQIVRRLQTIKEYEESGLDISYEDSLNVISKLMGESPRSPLTGKQELLKMNSANRKLGICKDSVDKLDPLIFRRTRETILNLMTRYKNEYKLSDLLFKASDFEYIEYTVKKYKLEQAKEERINRYAGVYALFLEKLDAGSEDIEELERYLTDSHLSEDELITGRIIGSELYEKQKIKQTEEPEARNA